MSANLYELFASRFPPDRTRTFIETPEGRVLSYADMERVVGRLTRLLQEVGVGPGERVAIQVEKSPEALLVYLASLRAGAICLPLNTAYTAHEIAYFLGDAEPKLFICDPAREAAFAERARESGVAEILTLDGEGRGSLTERAQTLDPDAGCHAAEGDDIAAILYTSGTTGRSKGAMLSHDNLASNALTLHDLWGFTPNDVLLHALPIFHLHGLFVATNCVLVNGTGMIFLRRFEPRRIMAELPRATVMMGVPTFYSRLLAEPDFGRDQCHGIRLFISGSAPLLEDTFQAFEARTGHRILERYGMSETSMNSSNPLKGERVPGTVGLPLPGVDLRITDDAGKELPPGKTGTIEVRGPNVFKGYWRMPEKTAEEIRPNGFFVTGDLGLIDDHGYVRIVGRAKDLIISGGFNVYPKEVEQIIDSLEGIAECAVIGVPHPDFGEAVVTVAVLEKNTNKPPQEYDLIEKTKENLANFKVPKRVFFVDELPRNAMGKVQKNLLRETYGQTFSPNGV